MNGKRDLRDLVPLYHLVVGGVLLAVGAATEGWWTMIVGGLLVAAGAAGRFGRGEATSWFRNELDERRQDAAGRSFRSAFLALAWWVAGATAVASTRPVPTALWSAGIVVALVVAWVDYARILRHT